MTLFGTDGIRAHLSSPLLQEHEFKKIIHKIAQWIMNAQKNPTILIGRDTRPSGPILQEWVKEVLSCYPCSIYDAHIIPTPIACALIHSQSLKPFTLGILITASHNNAEFNGIKLYTPNGKLTEKEEQYIEGMQKKHPSTTPKARWHTLSSIQIKSAYNTCIQKHFTSYKPVTNSIVIDCAHGALSLYAPDLLAAYGDIICISEPYNGEKINNQCGATHPETLVQAVKQHNAHIGFAFDGDGDRIIAVNKDGIIYDGDDILYLLSHHPVYKNQPLYVGTIMSNQGLEHALDMQHKKFIRTPVGDKHVIKALQEHGSLLGAESSGHVVCNDVGPWADGLVTAIRILETLAELKDWPKLEKFETNTYSIDISSTSSITTDQLNILCIDALKKLPQGRCIIRKSGTEPVIRIRVEDKNAQHAHQVGEYIKQCVFTLMQRT